MSSHPTRACIECSALYVGDLDCPECGAPGEPLQAWTCTQASPDSLFQVGEVLSVDPEKNLN